MKNKQQNNQANKNKQRIEKSSAEKNELHKPGRPHRGYSPVGKGHDTCQPKIDKR